MLGVAGDERIGAPGVSHFDERNVVRVAGLTRGQGPQGFLVLSTAPRPSESLTRRSGTEREAVEMALDLVGFRELARGVRALRGLTLSRID